MSSPIGGTKLNAAILVLVCWYLDSGSPKMSCQNGACTRDLDLKIRSKFRAHEMSIGIAAFPIGGLLVRLPQPRTTITPKAEISI